MNKNLLYGKLLPLFVVVVISTQAQITFTNSNTILHSNTGVVGSNGNLSRSEEHTSEPPVTDQSRMPSSA